MQGNARSPCLARSRSAEAGVIGRMFGFCENSILACGRQLRGDSDMPAARLGWDLTPLSYANIFSLNRHV